MPVVFGFQIVQAFRNNYLIKIRVRKCMHFDTGNKYGTIFKTFDEYMYQARLQYKKDKNASMAQCIKLFINSLYGKFGEKHHPVDMRMPASDFGDDEYFQSSIVKRLRAQKGISEDFESRLDQLHIKCQPLFDLNNRDKNLVNVKISNIPMNNAHIGSFVYYASLITAIGRTCITNLINRVSTGDQRVYYADTDSLIVNK